MIEDTTKDAHGNRLCDRCHARPAMRHSLSVVGPFDTRETYLCVSCQELSDAEAVPPAEDDLGHLGPIDFELLRASIDRIDQEPARGGGVRGFLPSAHRAVPRTDAPYRHRRVPRAIFRLVERNLN